MKNKLYILIDKNLDPIYGAVQGGHAVADWVRYEYYKTIKDGEHNILWDWNNDYLIYLSVDINEWKEKLWRFDPGKFKWMWFNEPDLDNKTTAIAIYAKDFPSCIKKELKQENLLGGV